MTFFARFPLPARRACALCPALLLFATAAGFSGCQKSKPLQNSRIVVDYWDKWTGFEADAIRAVVDDFNASQTRIFVNYTSMSQIDRKLMLSTAGGDPPDVAGVWSRVLPAYAENNALIPLERLAGENGITRDRYIDVYWRMCTYRDHLWALPSTPGSIGLIWNKKLFRDAGLDPDKPPRSIAELERFNQKLVKWRPDGRIQSIGHLPEEPGWYSNFWGYWFGGRLWDGKDRITANSPENVAAYQWLESYPERFGADNLLALHDGFGNFASAQNAFFTGRVAMVLQGPWIYNFIKNYAPPDFEWDVAPFPSVDPQRFKDVSLVESDVLVIPAGARHPREAFEFIKYVNSQGPMEKLCLGQLRFSPFRETSPSFISRNPNPHIDKFIALAKSPNAIYAPQLTTWAEYSADLANATGRVWRGSATAREALDAVQEREQSLLDKRNERWNANAVKLTSQWNNE